MFDFFTWIIDFFEKIFMLISNFIDSLLQLGLILQQAVLIPPLLLGFVPGLIGASIGAVASIGVIKLLLGWGNN